MVLGCLWGGVGHGSLYFRCASTAPSRAYREPVALTSPPPWAKLPSSRPERPRGNANASAGQGSDDPSMGVSPPMGVSPLCAEGAFMVLLRCILTAFLPQ